MLCWTSGRVLRIKMRFSKTAPRAKFRALWRPFREVGVAHSVFKRKSLDDLRGEATEHGLYRQLGAADLVALGIGATFGGGAFILIGEAAGGYAGPAVLISIVIIAVASFLAALCYAEFASMVPISGSAYSYVFASLGEIGAYAVGWNLILGYVTTTAVLGIGWSAYVVSLMGRVGIHISDRLVATPITDISGNFGVQFHLLGNLPAALVVLLVSAVLVPGIRASAASWQFSLTLRVALALLSIIGLFYFHRSNFVPFIPQNTGRFGEFGWSGVLVGAGFLAFMFAGADAVASAGQEARRPSRDIPVALIASIGITGILYCGLALAVLGLARYDRLRVANPLSKALDAMGAGQALSFLIELAVVISITSVIMTWLLSIPRLVYSISKDGLLPKVFSRLHPRFQTPYVTSITVGLLASLLAGVVPLDTVARLTSLAMLTSFAVIFVAVVVLRRLRPRLARPYRIPFAPLVAALGFLICVSLVIALVSYDFMTGLLWLAWLAFGFLTYVMYGYRQSRLRA
jgi:APA family basic amino acid/polyamine antiporter